MGTVQEEATDEGRVTIKWNTSCCPWAADSSYDLEPVIHDQLPNSPDVSVVMRAPCSAHQV